MEDCFRQRHGVDANVSGTMILVTQPRGYAGLMGMLKPGQYQKGLDAPRAHGLWNPPGGSGCVPWSLKRSKSGKYEQKALPESICSMYVHG